MARITVYTTHPCAYCARAKALLHQKGLDFEEINLARDAEGRDELVHKTGLMTFPQIVIDGETVGGFNELARSLANGDLDRRLAA